MNPKFKYSGEYQYKDLTSITEPEGPRTYTTPYGNASSVTTILSMLPAPGLDAWIEAVGLEEAERIRDEAATIGTCMHNRLESYVKGEPYQPLDSPLEQIAHTLFMAVRTMALGPLTEVWGVEEALYLYDLYAGRTDVMGIYSGKRSIIDYKTGLRSKNDDVLDKYKLQISLYGLAHDWMFRDFDWYQPIEQGIILVGVRPTKWNPSKIQKIVMPKEELQTYKWKAIEVIINHHVSEHGEEWVEANLDKFNDMIDVCGM